MRRKQQFTLKLSDDAGTEASDSPGAGYFTSMNTTKTGLLSSLYNNNLTIALLDAYNAQNNTMRTSLGQVQPLSTLWPSGTMKMKAFTVTLQMS